MTVSIVDYYNQEKNMAKSLGIVAVQTRRLALDYWNKLDTLMKSGRINNVCNEMWT